MIPDSTPAVAASPIAGLSDPMPVPDNAIWVVGDSSDADLAGRLGDARELADRNRSNVGVLQFSTTGDGYGDRQQAQAWIEYGADDVHILNFSHTDPAAWTDAALAFWRGRLPRLVLASAGRIGRAWSARLAARTGWPLASPALLVQCRNQQYVVTRLDASGRRARQVVLPEGLPSIVALRPGVAQPLPRDAARRGTVEIQEIAVDRPVNRPVTEHLPPDPGQADIRHLPKLVAGGRGVGGKAGFETLRRIAHHLGAGVAASRMAVDLGWIEAERQVGQTGKTVRPELYLACGISGATHHREGMSGSRHVVAINTDAQAPLMQQAELALQADLHEVLKQLARLLEQTA